MSYLIRLPISVLIFYLLLLFLIYLNLIPSIPQIIDLLKNLYLYLGLGGLFLASFLEGIAYIGLYFPGSLIIALAAMFSDGSFGDLSLISLVVAIALTLSSVLNYYFGRYNLLNKFLKPVVDKKLENESFKKGFFLSFLHPNALGFYFYTLGARKKKFGKKLILVPIIMFPYGLFLAYLFYSLRDILESAVENPFIMITIISIWFLIAVFIAYFSNKKRKSNYVKIKKLN
ncbi:MAG: hypothetical protein KC550_02230 [Nanoarchaeota archaeon]|nr:hypothetical protein [Nanoarchaeota archaeon]